MNPTLVRDDLRHWRLTPDPRLRPGVLCYFVSLPGKDRPSPSAEELLLPDGYSEMVFTIAAAFERRSIGEPSAAQLMRSSYLIGGRSHSVVTRSCGDITVVGVKLEPHLLRRIIGTPLSTFRDSTLSLADLNDPALRELEDALANARSPAAVRRTFDAFFLSRLHAVGGVDPHVLGLQRQIRAMNGAVPILRWIREERIDQRHFERRFCAWVGMTPKRYARIVRFKHSYYRLLRGEAARGAMGLHLQDYYDQSHFHRDYKYFVGSSPSAKTMARAHRFDLTNHLIEGEYV